MAGVIGLLLVLAMWGFIIWALLRGRASAKFVPLPDEQRIAFINAQCKDIKYGGFIVVGTPHDGKLILTNFRLVHTNVKESKVGLVVFRDQISDITKGSDGPLMTLDLTYQTPQMKKPKRTRFLQVSSVSGVDMRQQLPIGMFIDKLIAWKAERAA